MNTPKSSSELKSKAKGQLLGKYGTVIPALLISEGILSIVIFIAAGSINISTAAGLILYYGISFMMQLVAGIFAVGQSHLYLNIACNQPYTVSDIFYGFKKCPDKAITIRFILSLANLICMLPALILSFFYMKTNFTYLIPFISIVLIIGGVVSCVIMLTYSQVFYLILDFPQYSFQEIMKASKLLMKGYKGKLFYLQVSFIPLFLLALFSCFLGCLWIIPYRDATYVHFYLDLVKIKSTPSN